MNTKILMADNIIGCNIMSCLLATDCAGSNLTVTTWRRELRLRECLELRHGVRALSAID
jgi:hypothetical protein